MKERDRLTRHSNISLIWHDTENTKTACIWLALGSHDVSVLESITVSERLANQRRESAANETNDDERVNESGERGQLVHFKESFVRTDSFANEPTLVSTMNVHFFHTLCLHTFGYIMQIPWNNSL